VIVDHLVAGQHEVSRGELVALIADQAGVIDELVARTEALTVQNQGLTAQNEALAVQVAELRRRLGLNSSNSSKPPSSDGLKKPPPRSMRDRSGRKPGKQPGAVGTTLAPVDDPDEVFEYRPDACLGCHTDLAEAPVVDVTRRQVFELPEIRRQVVEHRLLSCRCACGRVSTATAPAGVNAPVQYGPGAAAAAVYLLVAHHIPFGRVVRILTDLLGCVVSAGWINDCLSRTAKALTGFRDRLRDGLRRAGVVHFDETGVRVEGRLRWAHTACTPLLTHYHLDDKRGQPAIDAHGILPGLRAPQVAVHDGWMPYFKKPYDVVDHALCNAHHLREFTGWADANPQNEIWANPFIDLLREGNRLVKKAKANGRTYLEPDVLTDLHHRWQQAIDQAYAANPPPPGKGRGPILALIDRMRGGATEIWRFAHDFTVPFDNNQAERDIRMIKLQGKISGSWRKITCARRWLQIREYISTTTKHGIATLTALRDAITGNAWFPALPE
jgi:transposase